uniref:Uncharacterized protein LOC109548705 isoform X1 n=1 Tax=Tursiops truncatus TaxID=9739 RepID=A0A6J3Q3N9_TURTR|nr:uncharacterized protein LOC109548705 isoform X1 [Tursiops truncatus]
MPAIPRPYRKPRLPRNLGVARRSALDCSRLAAAGALRSRGRAWPAPATARARRRLWAWGTGSGGRGGRRWNVGELEGGAGPLGGADGGHRGGRAYEAAAGPAGAVLSTLHTSALIITGAQQNQQGFVTE